MGGAVIKKQIPTTDLGAIKLTILVEAPCP